MKQTFTSLEGVLNQMNGCAAELEQIIEIERLAVRELNGDALIELMDRRAACHNAIANLERECKAILVNAGVPENMTLEAFIELHAGSDAPHYESLRRGLYDRMMHLEESNSENYIRMHAAYDVTSSVLQKIGIGGEEKQTYSRGQVR